MNVSEDTLKVLEDFRDKLMDRFLSLCNYNDYDKINLLTIGDTVDNVYDTIVEDLIK